MSRKSPAMQLTAGQLNMIKFFMSFFLLISPSFANYPDCDSLSPPSLTLQNSDKIIIEGAKGNTIEISMNISTLSNLILINTHGLGQDLTQGDFLDDLQTQYNVSIIKYTSSRYKNLPLSKANFSEIFGKQDGKDYLTMNDLIDDLRKVIIKTKEVFENKSQNKSSLRFILVGESQGSQIVAQVAHEFDEVIGIVLLSASMVDFSKSRIPKNKRHPVVRTPLKEEVGKLFNKFKGDTVIINGDQDMKSRNKSARNFESYKNINGGTFVYMQVDDGHSLNKPSSSKIILKIIEENLIRPFFEGTTRQLLISSPTIHSDILNCA